MIRTAREAGGYTQEDLAREIKRRYKLPGKIDNLRTQIVRIENDTYLGDVWISRLASVPWLFLDEETLREARDLHRRNVRAQLADLSQRTKELLVHLGSVSDELDEIRSVLERHERQLQEHGISLDGLGSSPVADGDRT